MNLVPMLVAQPSAPDSQNHGAFKVLCQQLLKLRNDVTTWNEVGSAFVAQHDGMLLYHQRVLMGLEIDFLLAAERRMDEVRLGFLGRDELTRGIRTLAQTYLTMPGAAAHKQALIEIFNRHSRVPYDTLMRQRALKAASEVGLAPSSLADMTLEEITVAISEETEKLFSSLFGDLADGLYGDVDDDFQPRRPADASASRRPNTPPPEHNRLREVYRALVRWLHPDREPDAQRRQQKTELLQKVNEAYRGGDLMTLLDLQVEAGLLTAEERAEAHGAFHDDLVASIRRQLRALRASILDMKASIKATACPLCPLPRRLTPKGLEKSLARMRADLDEALDDASCDNREVATAHADQLVYLVGERVAELQI